MNTTQTMSAPMTADRNLATDARFWDSIARKYAAARIGDMEGYERTLARTAAFLPPEGRVLELGCGTGTTALRLAPLAGSYLATDLSPAMIAIAREKQAAENIGEDTGEQGRAGPENPADSSGAGLFFLAATVESVTAPESGFDLVLGFNYLHLVDDPAATLASIRQLLRPGGLVITKTVCLNEMNAAIPMLIRLLRLIGKAPATVSRLGEADLLRAHEQAGFEILHNERHGSGKRDIRPFLVARRT